MALDAYLKDIIAAVAAANIILKPPVFVFCSILNSESFDHFLVPQFSHVTCNQERGILSTCASLSFFNASVFTLPLTPVLACSTLNKMLKYQPGIGLKCSV